jgi:hypothetical protein
LLLNDDADFEVGAKVNKLVAVQYPNIEKPAKERPVRCGSRLNKPLTYGERKSKC